MNDDHGGGMFELLWNAALTVGLALAAAIGILQREKAAKTLETAEAAMDKAEEARRALEAHKLHVAEQFATKDAVRAVEQKIDARCDKIEDKLDDRFDKLEHKIEAVTTNARKPAH